jgi:aerobic carbon-monoxide dehydrogenase medium subunit
MTATRVLAPADLDAAVEILQAYGSEAALLAGGVTWMLRQARGEDLPSVLISLEDIDALAGVVVHDDRLTIGAMTRLIDLERSSAIAATAPGLAETIAHVGSVRIRSQATIGGNLAAGVPRYDPPPMLMALDTRVRLHGPAGTRELALADWSPHDSTGPGVEILVAVEIPTVPRRWAARYRSVDDVLGVDLVHAASAARIDVDGDGAIADARLIVADALVGPRRCTPAEQGLIGRHPVAETAADVAALVPAGDAAGADRGLVAIATRRALLAAFADLASEPAIPWSGSP